MPEMDGYEATREIRKREGDSRHTTVIAMTANALGGDRERCLEAGMDDYVSKPVKRETLAEAIERWTVRSPRRQPADVIEPASANPGNVIDSSVISELRGLQSSADPDFFNHLIDLFLEETPHRLAAIKDAVAGADAKALAHEAHALKGSSAHLGARRIAALCEILEEQGRGGSVLGAQALLNVLLEEFDRVHEALEGEKL